MPSISLKAHYDGTAIRLDEPFDLPEGAQLIVTVLEAAESDQERAERAVDVARELAWAGHLTSFGENLFPR
jgi:hypothetical protein